MRSAGGTGEDRITSDWSTHVTGMTEAAPPPPEPPATPTGLEVSATTETSITWTWNAVEGAAGYVRQANRDEMFDVTDTVLFNGLPFTTETSYTASDLEPETAVYVRVAAGVGTPTDPLLSAFTSHVTGMTMAAAPEAPAAPANLREKDTGSDYIEWEWDEVEGADGYESEFSTDSSLSDANAVTHQGMSNTTRRVSRLEADTDGYLRVRAYTGTLTDRVFGEWSETDEGTTDEPPPAVALDTPDDFESSDPDNVSIVLTWDAVDDADHYEVEQREDGASSWDDASCGGDDNEVDDTECIAGGLDEGTDYEFRVRAIPASDDTANTTGAWAETEGTTEGAAQVVSPGGTGDLSVSWTSTATTITWKWEPMSGAKYQWDILDGPYDDAAKPCADVDDADWSAASAQYEHTENATQGDVNLLCVRTDDEDNRALSFAWATTTPEGATVAANNAGATNNEKFVTTSLTWADLDIKAGFEYEVRVAVDPQRDDDIGPTTSAKAIQAACAAGTFVDQGDTDINFELDEISVSRGLTSHAGYLLCWNMANTAGATAWAVPATNGEIYTNPGSPPTPRIDSFRTVTTATTESVVWRLAVRNEDDVPRDDSGFVAKRITYNENWDDSGTKRTTTAPKVAVCEEGNGSVDATSGTWTVGAAGTISTDNQGITVASGTVDRPDSNGDDGDTRIHLCVRANDDGRMGPWVFSGSHEVKRQAAP